MQSYFDAYRERLKRNQDDLFKLASDVLAIDPEIEIYHSKLDRFIEGLVFIKGEQINSLHFHDVPYRWSGCGYDEFNKSHRGGDNYSMPFTAEEVIKTLSPITYVRKDSQRNFKNTAEYLKSYTFLVKYVNP